MNLAVIRRFLGLLALSKIHGVFAATVVLQPVADTTLIEAAPTNNLGGSTFVNAGTSGIGTRNRGLYKFDFSSIPPYSKIKSAAVTLEVLYEPNAGGVSSMFGLYRLLKSWGEGDKITIHMVDSSGFGLPATTNEATWNSRFAFTTNNWTSPGASNDFATVISSSTQVYGTADFPYFGSTPQMVADVQIWVNDSSSNFGWLLKTESESTLKTARGFGSREFAGEDTNSPPKLQVEFIAPPTLFNPQITNGQFSFSFLAEANEAYKVEFINAFASTNSWLTVTNINAPMLATNISVSDPISSSTRFYRVIPQ